MTLPWEERLKIINFLKEQKRERTSVLLDAWKATLIADVGARIMAREMYINYSLFVDKHDDNPVKFPKFRAYLESFVEIERTFAGHIRYRGYRIPRP